MAQEEEVAPEPKVGEVWRIGGDKYLIQEIFTTNQPIRQIASLKSIKTGVVYEDYNMKFFHNKDGAKYLWEKVVEHEASAPVERETIEI